MKGPTVTASTLERVRPWLMAAAEWGNEGLTWPLIREGIAAGDYHLLHNATAAVLLEPYAQDDGRLVICVLLAGGDLEGVTPLLQQAEEIARHNNCSKITAVARPGWRAFAHRIGYRMEAVHYSKDL